MEFLKKNALKFLSEAKEAFGNIEILYKKYREFPKTHNLRMLFELTKDENLNT